MDVIAIVYAIAVGVIAVVGLYKAYKNDGKISREEIDDIVSKVDDLYNSKNKQ